MKNVFLILVGIVITMVSSFAQGQLNFSNRSTSDGIDAKVVTSPFGGSGVTSPEFMAQLVRVTSTGNIAVGAPVAFRTGAAAGYIISTILTVDGVPAGTAANFQMLVISGSVFSEAAVQLRSSVVSVTLTAAPNPPAALVGLRDISGLQYLSVPEPSTIGLGILGAAALLVRRKK